MGLPLLTYSNRLAKPKLEKSDFKKTALQMM